MEEAEDEPLFCERVAGIDIGKKMIMVTIRVPSEARKGGRQQETREFGTTRKELLALADWLRCWQVERVGMESTSDYWKPVYFLLEREGFDSTLYQAPQVKVLPGRPKTDKLDSVWLAKITERGSLAGSFVPPEEIRRLRTHTRYRRKLVQMRSARKERCEKLLEDALDCSFFTEEHAFILQMMLDSIDQLTAQITVLDEKIAEMCRPYERQIEQLDDVPGFAITTGQDLIAEIGTDMSVFPTAGHLSSWARQAPRVTESGGKRKGKNATGRGNPYIGGTLGEASISVGRTQTFLGAKYRRLCTHMPKGKAQVAIMRTQLVIAHALLSDPDARYEDLGPDYYERKADIRRRAHSHARALERLGYKVTIEAIDTATGELLPVTAGR